MRRVYPDKEIYDLEGNLLEDDNSSAAMSSTGGPVPGNYQFPKFGNFEKDIVAYGFSWHITFKGAASANRARKTALAVASGSGEEQLYDSAELTRYNHPLYGDSKRRILKDGSGHYRQYSKELESQEILNRVYDFISALEKSLQEENLPTLIHLLPHKENGTLCKGRKNVLLTCSFCDHQGMSYSFFARSVSDTAAELRVRKVYIGDPEYTRDDLFDTFRAVLPAGNPISQPGKAEETTKAPEPIKKDPAAESVNTAGQAGNTSGGSGPGIRIKKRHTDKRCGKPQQK